MLTSLAHLFRYRLHRIHLRPVDQITERGNLYSCTGSEPQIELTSNRNSLPRRWVFVSYQAEDVDSIFAPALAYSTGAGYSEKNLIHLPHTSLARGALIRLPYNLQALRLNPAARPGMFRLASVSFLEVGFIPLLLILSWRELAPDLGRPVALAAKLLKGIAYVCTRGPVSARNRLAGRHQLRHQARVACDYAIARPPVAPDDAQWQDLPAGKRTGSATEGLPVIDVIIPVYKGYDETLNCIYRVLTGKNDSAFELIVINDASPDARLAGKLRALSDQGLFTLHTNRKNAGFVKTVNAGMRLHPDRDVVLLNSDTGVYNNWLDRLKAAAYATATTGTVTPFSNNAEICSYPYPVQDNNMQLELDCSELDRVVSAVNEGQRVRIPTAVGFCMYIRRDCLNDTGYFDAAAFGRGYGEENDFCLRAELAGWVHVLAADTFVRHLGGSSFGQEKLARMNEAIRVINARYPGYDRRIQDFLQEDPLRDCRRNIDIGRLGRQAGRDVVLFVSHDWGGGIEKHVQDMSGALVGAGALVCYLRPHRENNLVGVISCPGTGFLPNLPDIDLQGGAEQGGDMIARLGVTHVHIHSLAGFSERIFHLLPDMLRVAGLQYDVTIHDYMTICPRIHLMDPGGQYCGEPAERECGICIRTNGSPFGRVDIGSWRNNNHALLGSARKVFVPNNDVAGRMTRYFPDIAFNVRPHPEPELDSSGLQRIAGAPATTVRVGIIGAIGPHKGSWLVQKCARDAQDRQLPLEFIIIGYTDIDDLKNEPNITVTGAYDEAEIPALVSRHRVQVIFFPATLPETYSYTLSQAVRAGLVPVAFDIGAIAERMRQLGYGAVLMPVAHSNNPALVNDFLLHHAAAGVNPVQEYRFARYPRILADYYQLQ